MRFYCALILSALALPTAVNAMFAEDAGVLDFSISTSGHGITRTVEVYGDAVLTTDSPSDGPTSCFVASRNIASGNLNWRRNVCSVPSDQQQHAMAVLEDYFFTMDNTGIVRAWTMNEGNLVWDAQVPAPFETFNPNIWTFSRNDRNYVAVAANAQLHILDATNGGHFDTLYGSQQHQIEQGETAQWLALLPDKGDGLIHAIFAFVDEDGITSGNRMFMFGFEAGDDQIKSTKALEYVNEAIIASSLQIQPVGDSMHVIALAPGLGNAVHFSLDDSNMSIGLPAAVLDSKWTSINSIATTNTPSLISIQGSDADSNPSMSLYRYDGSGSWGDFNAERDFNAVTYCPAAEIVVAMSPSGLQLFRWSGASLTLKGDILLPDGDIISKFEVLECTSQHISVLLSTERGTTTALLLDITGDSVTSKIAWMAEEGLARISSAVLLDASHLGVDDLVEEKDVVMQKLSLPSRMSSQWSSILGLLSGGVADYSRRDHIFGFMKVAATVSQKSHRMWGIDTFGQDRGSVRWSVDLPKNAKWHAMVHGTTNSVSSLHGINGGTHSREILVLSPTQSFVDWKCVDGTNGAIHAHGAIDIVSPVLQVIPIYGSSGGCRQSSLLLHEDLSLTVVPNDAETASIVQQQLNASKNGLFTHSIDKSAGVLQAFRISESSGAFIATQVGRAGFPGERVVKISYPIRDEVVQSMCTILGDDSLLLKYINPHLAAVVTMIEEEDSSPTDIVSSIEKKNKKPRKPVGAGDAATAEASPTESMLPNMFINLVDTVSGRVLHRASHYNVDPSSNIAMVISENWVLYSFVNSKTRRTELAVLTLHEGMIESKGLTMFSSPEQTSTFSSLDVRNSKPVVLAKTYTFPKTITALGTTATRGGISSRKVLVASVDGKITSIDRSMLETRRPVGELKEAEKKEGLFPYKELIPEVSIMALNYNRTIESIRSIVATPTSLESQSLIFAFGGPDLFFTRTSPSRGFDLLPDSFSKVLVSIVTIGLVVVLFVVKRMGIKKTIKQGWM